MFLYCRYLVLHEFMNQETTLQIMKSGKNIFLTWQAGSGKTYVLNKYIQWCWSCDIPVAITASTGIAATHIWWVTIHSWSGIGIADSLSEQEIHAIASKNRIRSNIQKTNVLIIDEISMLYGEMLDNIERIIQAVRYDESPWGGMQVIFCGDFFQLPPISRHWDTTKRFAFAAKSWNASDLHFCYLDTQHRQEDNKFQKILDALRVWELTQDMIVELEHRRDTVFQDTPFVRLYTHNMDVDRINQEQLEKLPGESKKFQAGTRGNKKFVAGLLRGMLAPVTLELKVDAHVICVKNNATAWYYNGTTAIVTWFDKETQYPIIQLKNGNKIIIEPETRNIENEEELIASVRQVPLKLARAITVHKSQGMTLDAAEVDLSRSFAYGQCYVALSRVKSLEWLRLLGLNKDNLKAHPLVLRWDVYFRSQSDELMSEYTDTTQQQWSELHKNFVESMDGTYLTTEELNNANHLTKELKKRKPKINTLDETIKLIEEWKSLWEIATTRDLKEQTIISHIIKISKIHPDIDITRFSPGQKLLDRVQSAVEQASKIAENINEDGNISLWSIYRALSGEVSYDDIKLSMAYIRD